MHSCSFGCLFNRVLLLLAYNQGHAERRRRADNSKSMCTSSSRWQNRVPLALSNQASASRHNTDQEAEHDRSELQRWQDRLCARTNTQAGPTVQFIISVILSGCVWTNVVLDSHSAACLCLGYNFECLASQIELVLRAHPLASCHQFIHGGCRHPHCVTGCKCNSAGVCLNYIGMASSEEFEHPRTHESLCRNRSS